MSSTVAFPHHHEATIPARIRGLIFDCDGTLVDTMPIHFQAWCKALAEYQLAFDEKRFYSFAGMPTRKIVEILATEQGRRELDPERIAHEKEVIYLQMMPNAEPIEEVIAIARREKGQRKLAVASGGATAIVKQALAAAGCEGLFEAIVGADQVQHGKPHPDIFLEAARQLGVEARDCLVYEDGEMGFVAAKAAGMLVIDVRPWYLPRESA